MEIMTLEIIQEKIGRLAKRVFDAAGMDLVELEVKGSRNDVLIEIIADKPNGGITIRECAILNKALVTAIEQDMFLPPENFSLELSSPGLDRPLVTRKDFLRVVGKDIHFWLNSEQNGKKEIEGYLIKVDDSSLEILKSGKENLVLPLGIIIKGMLVL